MKKLLIFLVFVFIFGCSKKEINDNGIINDFEFDNYIESYDPDGIIPDSILERLDKQQLRIIRNSIYAKHGYIFKSGDLQDYFSQFSWYSATKNNVDNELTEIDLLNVQNIISYENNLDNQGTAQLVNVDSRSMITQYSNLFTDLSAIAEYLKTANATMENPISIKLNISLGTMADADSNWRRLLKILDDAGKYIALDLSSCPIAGIDFNPIPSVQTGKWFIISLILPDTAKNIPNGTARGSTFSYFNNLKTLRAKEITSIGVNAFNDCNNLSVSFPAMTNIAEYTFNGCESLTSADFPLVTDIEGNAFADCTKLININLPSAISIGENAFSGCTDLIRISSPVVKTINRNAFEDCSSLLSINFPAITIVENGTFANCISLTSISFPLVKTIGTNFYGSKGAFQNCTSLISASFPSVTTIGYNSFQGCTGLTNISFPVTTTIGGNAFQYCESLTDIYFPSATEIGELAFADCSTLASVNFPEARAFNHDYFYGRKAVFEGCTSLISVTIGEHYYYRFDSALPGDLTRKYFEGGAGTYTRSIGSDYWTKQ